jgi:hypothetical protein
MLLRALKLDSVNEQGETLPETELTDLKKLGDVGDDIAKDKLFLFGVEPAQLCDPSEEGHQTLDDELGELRLAVQVGQGIVSCRNKIPMKINQLPFSAAWWKHGSQQGTLTEGEGSVQLTSLYQLA